MSARVRVATDREGGLVTIKAARTVEERQALRYEAELLRRCSHPGVVALVGPTDLAEPLADDELAVRYAGDPIDRWRGDLRRTAGLVAAIAATLGDLHDMGVVHGRLDGSHVLVGGDGRPRLCGFAPADDRTPTDDVIDLGHLATDLAERMVPGEQRWPLWRRGDVADRRAFLEVLRRATDEPDRRPSARVLAASLLAAVPGAELPTGAGPPPPPHRPRTGEGADVGWGIGVAAPPSSFDLTGPEEGAPNDPTWPWRSEEPTGPGDPVGSRGPAVDETGGGAPSSAGGTWPGGGLRTGEAGPVSGPAGRAGADPFDFDAPWSVLDDAHDPEHDVAPGDGARPSMWSPAAPSRFVRPEDRRAVVGAAIVTGADDPTEDEDPWRSRLSEPPGDGPGPAPGDDGDRTRCVDPLFGDQSSAELDEVFAHRPWPADGSRGRRGERSPRHPSPSRRRRQQRRRSTRGVPAAPVVAGLAAVVVGAVLYFSGWAAPPDRPDPSRASSGCPPPSSSAPVVADVDGDGCGEEVTIAGGIVQVDDRRWAVAEADDSVAVADWDCDGRATPAVYQAATGDVFVFPSWADESGPLEVPASGSVVGGTGIAAADADDPCPSLAIEMPDGAPRPVEVAG